MGACVVEAAVGACVLEDDVGACVTTSVVTEAVVTAVLQTGSLVKSSDPFSSLKNHCPFHREHPPGAFGKFSISTGAAFGSSALLATPHSSIVLNSLSELQALLG